MASTKEYLDFVLTKGVSCTNYTEVGRLLGRLSKLNGSISKTIFWGFLFTEIDNQSKM